MTTAAFAGHELTMEAYYEAIKEKYRFFAYGDALMVI
jgi:S-adenosylmethionine:tRNA ribosyltransferase-isomerase